MKSHRLLLAVLLALRAAAPAADPARTSDHDYDAPQPGTYRLPVIGTAAGGALLDSDGNPANLRDLTRGRVTVLSFIYTRCSDAKACPYATGVLRELHLTSRSDAALARGMRLVSMSFDPAHDTPERLQALASLADAPEPAAEWRFVTAPSREALMPVLDAYGQAVAPKRNSADPLGPLNHNLRVFLIDAAGKIRNIYSSGTLDVRLVLADVRTLLLEKEDLTHLTPDEAAGRAGESCTVAFKVESAARVTNITSRDGHRPLEVLLLDAANGDHPRTPAERANIVVRIPDSACADFGAQDMDELVRRFEGRTVAVTGLVHVEPHPMRSGEPGSRQVRPVLTITGPDQIAVEGEP